MKFQINCLGPGTVAANNLISIKDHVPSRRSHQMLTSTGCADCDKKRAILMGSWRVDSIPDNSSLWHGESEMGLKRINTISHHHSMKTPRTGNSNPSPRFSKKVEELDMEIIQALHHKHDDENEVLEPPPEDFPLPSEPMTILNPPLSK